MEYSVYLARQPILNRKGDIFAYELLYRDTNDNCTDVCDNLHASARVLVNTLNYIGLRTMTQGHKAFVKVDEKILMDEIIHAISPAYFVLEILENVIITAELIGRIAFLRNKGYTFALNHYRFDHDIIVRYAELLREVTYVKVDITQAPKPDEIVEALKPYRLTCIAEKVEDQSTFEKARDYGFDYFQGYYFCRPDLFEKERFDPDSSQLLELIYLLKTEAPLEELLKAFDKSAYLTINLLKFIRLQEGFSADAVSSIEQALVLIGRDRLTSWLELMFYADGGDKNVEAAGHAQEITRQALERACLMEELAHTVRTSSRFADAAYITGILSISDTMFHSSCQELLSEIKIDQNIADALLSKKGDLGRLLELVEAIEKDDSSRIAAIMLELDISEEMLNRALLESYRRSATAP
jgi:EAL and modified HD-GYP domain-containing signal transduction protein